MIAYESPRVTLHLADAAEVLPTLPKESFDLILTDPPYGVDFQSGMRAESFDKIANDSPEDREAVREILRECVRLAGQSRHLYVFGPEALDGLKVSAPAQLVWDKLMIGMGDLNSAWGPGHELIHFYVSQWRHAGKAGKPNTAVRLRKGSVLRFPRPTGRKVRHPSEKPVLLLQELLESSTRIGEVVLDPFAGIGSTGVAAILSGRRAVLVEVSEANVAIAIERLREAEFVRDAAEVC